MLSLSPYRSWLFRAGLLGLIVPSLASAQGIERPRIPLRTALAELRVFRATYSDAFNKKDSAAVADLYAPNAIFIQGDGTVLVGKEAIRNAIDTEAPKWPQMTIKPDSVRVIGHTAWEVGTTESQGSGGSEQVSHYLVVLRRGMKEWKISSLAVVPERGGASPSDSSHQ